ncbi:MAG: A/G-specific adenine glycosylase [Ruminococcaceae bacterium]|nr:A/G-specific adenine glycosylase [Oscillospiraceae bacterium]
MEKYPTSLLQEIILPLLSWFRAERKPLPWRLSPTAYHVWISEIMLQQTRIEAVIPYYERFLRALPDVKSLAEVDDEGLMKLWEGLGYYSRARNLKKAAQKVMSTYGGELPKKACELQTLNGIGPYTAGAIASIAFGEPSAAVDGNVLRVVTRLCASHDDIMQAKTRTKVTAALEEVYPRGKEAGELTEALMELGENVCIPNGQPRCQACPLAAHCLARQKNEQELLPIKTPPKARRIEKRTVLLLKCGDQYALHLRGDKGLLARLWEFPNLEGTLDENEALAAARTLGATPTAASPAGEAIHIFSHVEWHMTGFLVSCEALPDTLPHATADEIRKSYAIPKAFRAYLEQI